MVRGIFNRPERDDYIILFIYPDINIGAIYNEKNN